MAVAKDEILAVGRRKCAVARVRMKPGTGKVLCLLTSHNGPCRGAIGIVDIAYGNNAQAGIRNLTPEVAIGEVDKGDGNQIRGPYENPSPMATSGVRLRIPAGALLP